MKPMCCYDCSDYELPFVIIAPSTEESTPISVSVETPVTMATAGTPNLAIYYTESSGQRLISTLSTSPHTSLPHTTHNGISTP